MSQREFHTLEDLRISIDALPNPQLANRLIRHLKQSGDCWIWRNTSPTIAVADGKTMTPRRAMLHAIGQDEVLKHEVTSRCGRNERRDTCCNPAHVLLRQSVARTGAPSRASRAAEVAQATAAFLRAADTLRTFGINPGDYLR